MFWCTDTITGLAATINIPLVHTAWLRDPLNDVYPKQAVTETELASVLQGITRLALLGDISVFFNNILTMIQAKPNIFFI